jgi:hypothetical protein
MRHFERHPDQAPDTAGLTAVLVGWIHVRG